MGDITKTMVKNSKELVELFLAGNGIGISGDIVADLLAKEIEELTLYTRRFIIFVNLLEIKKYFTKKCWAKDSKNQKCYEDIEQIINDLSRINKYLKKRENCKNRDDCNY